jgi:hypothetical protein
VLSRRWSAGIGQAGVEAEVKVIAFLKREGAGVELFSTIESGKVPECRFLAGNALIYAEVSQRGISKVMKRANQILFPLSPYSAAPLFCNWRLVCGRSELVPEPVRQSVRDSSSCIL